MEADEQGPFASASSLAYERSQLLKCFRTAKTTDRLQLSHFNLFRIPERVYQMTFLTRLDLGWNQLKTLPSSIGKLTNLEQLWINHNPIAGLPIEIEECKKLKQLDLRNTLITTLPRELGRIKGIVDVDILDVNLKKKLAQAHAAGGTRQLMQKLKHKDVRKNLKIKLEFKLMNVVYREVADEPGSKEKIQRLVKAIFKEFLETQEQRQVIRNCERLFPEDLDAANASKIKATYVALRRENDKKQLRAELDLKMRAIYFNRFRLDQIVAVLDGVYVNFPQLEDIQFLIKHASKLFPAQVADVDCAALFKKMDALRTKLRNERNNALAPLHRALKAMYHDVDPKKVEGLLADISAAFKRTVDIRKLCADHATFFPVEFESANAKQIRKNFVNQRG